MDAKACNSSINKLLKHLEYFKNSSNPFYRIDKEDIFYPYIYSKKVNEFIITVKMEDFTIVYDWTSWQDEASKYFEDPDLLSSANITILKKLLTLIIRKERFCSGFIKSAIESGVIVAALERLEVIRYENTCLE